MHPAALAATLVAGFALAWWLTGQMRRYALARNLLDRPNARSSHRVPTPRGGGVAIVVTFLLIVAVLAAADVIERNLGWAILGAGTLVAVLGFVDDRASLRARWRFLGHIAAALWVYAGMGPIQA